MLETEVDRQSTPDGETEVQRGREVVLVERHVAGVGDEVVWSVVHGAVGLLHKAAVDEAKAYGDAAVGVGEVEREGDVDIVHREAEEPVGVMRLVLGAPLGKVGLDGELPHVVVRERQHGADTCGDAPFLESSELVASHLRCRGTDGGIGSEDLVPAASPPLGLHPVGDEESDK